MGKKENANLKRLKICISGKKVTEYDPTVDPSVLNEFATVAFRSYLSFAQKKKMILFNLCKLSEGRKLFIIFQIRPLPSFESVPRGEQVVFGVSLL